MFESAQGCLMVTGSALDGHSNIKVWTEVSKVNIMLSFKFWGSPSTDYKSICPCWGSDFWFIHQTICLACSGLHTCQCSYDEDTLWPPRHIYVVIVPLNEALMFEPAFEPTHDEVRDQFIPSWWRNRSRLSRRSSAYRHIYILMINQTRILRWYSVQVSGYRQHCRGY